MASDGLIRKIQEHIAQLPDAEVLKYLTGDPGDYNPAAIEAARGEAERRQLPVPAKPAPDTAGIKIGEQPSFFQKAARASFWAPIVALAFGYLTLGRRDQDRSVAMVIGFVNCLIIVGGLVLAIVALLGMRKVGRRGVLAYGLAGLVFNGLLIATMIILWVAAHDVRHRVDAQKESPATHAKP